MRWMTQALHMPWKSISRYAEKKEDEEDEKNNAICRRTTWVHI
jgi:hypothetical protein